MQYTFILVRCILQHDTISEPTLFLHRKNADSIGNSIVTRIECMKRASEGRRAAFRIIYLQLKQGGLIQCGQMGWNAYGRDILM